MLPISSLTAQKLSNLLTNGNALSNQVAALGNTSNISLPGIAAANVVLSSAAPDLADKSIQLSYPRVCIYSDRVKNTKVEKFRSFSGTVAMIAELWASGNMVQQTDQWIHFYAEAVTSILRSNLGDWGDGVFFSGVYDIHFTPPKVGGFGFLQSAKVACTFDVSRA